MKRFTLIVPIYNNASNLADLLDRVTLINTELERNLEVIFVIDGSPDNSLQTLRAKLPEADFASRLVVHSRNFGSFAAIKTGLEHSSGDYIAVMAADLQEPMELILSFFRTLEEKEFEIAIGTRQSRKDPKFSKILSSTYWNFYSQFIQKSMPRGGVDVFGISRRVATQLITLNESHSSLVGLLIWVGYKSIEIPYERVRRLHGKSAWSMQKKFKYLMDSVFSFSSLPISIILVVGLIGTASTFLLAVIVFLTWLFGGIAVPGYAAQMLVQLFASGSLLFALGILGTYIWRTYENSKMRPGAIVMAEEFY